MTDETGSGPADELRRRAEEKATADEGTAPNVPVSPDATQRVLHELRVHQIELEMQNEELRRAQAELSASRERYFDLYDFAPVGYVTLSDKNLILEANLTAATLLGVARGALVKQPLSTFILPADQDIYYQHRKLLFETNKRQTCELRMLRAGAEPFWVRLDATVAQDASGAPVCRTVISDISASKRAEEDLRESDRFAHAIVNALSANIAVLDDTGTIIAVNHAWRAFAEANPPQKFPIHEGLNYLSVCDAAQGTASEEAAPVAAGIRAIIAGTQDHFEIEYACHSPDVQRWFICRVTRFTRSGSVRVVVAHEDITARRKTEEALRANEERLSLALKSAHMGVFEWDVVDNRRFFDEHVHQMLGTHPKTFTGKAEEFFNVVHPEDRQGVQAALAKAVNGREPYQSEYRALLPDGSVRHITARGGVHYDDGGRPLRLVGVCWDVTEQKRLEDAQSFLVQCGCKGDDFFESLAKYLATTLDMYFVCIDRLLPDGLTAQTVSVYCNGKFEDNVSYALKDTPCGDVVGKAVCCFPKTDYPKSSGK